MQPFESAGGACAIDPNLPLQFLGNGLLATKLNGAERPVERCVRNLPEVGEIEKFRSWCIHYLYDFQDKYSATSCEMATEEIINRAKEVFRSSQT
jgi:hypothetical protein